MDLGAYLQIEDLSEIAKKNGIEVPRLRGYRLMSEESAVTKDEIKDYERLNEVYAVESLCRSFWISDSDWHEHSAATNRIKKRYIGEKDGFEFVRWDRIHGAKRKKAKRLIKQFNKDSRESFSIWNKYAGREDVLCVHARIGGYNWREYEGDKLVASQPWFLEKVDDPFDSTYCDIFAKINLK